MTTTITGRVKWWSEERKFGFIRRHNHQPDQKDDFVHVTAVDAAGIKTLQEGDEVSYVMVPDTRHRDRLIVGNLKLI